jgi:hypothetical protein
MEDSISEDPVKPIKITRSDSCGCAMGARFMGVGFLASAVFYGWRFYENETSFSTLIIRTLIITFISAGLGKLTGISIHHLKKQ